MKSMFRLVHEEARRRALETVLNAPDGYIVAVQEPTRSVDQNACLWAVLTDVSEQVEWYGRKLTPDNWKNVFSAALKQQEVVPGIDGGFVVLGQSTSRMTKSEFSDLLELIHAFGFERGVKFREDA